MEWHLVSDSPFQNPWIHKLFGADTRSLKQFAEPEPNEMIILLFQRHCETIIFATLHATAFGISKNLSISMFGISPLKKDGCYVKVLGPAFWKILTAGTWALLPSASDGLTWPFGNARGLTTVDYERVTIVTMVCSFWRFFSVVCGARRSVWHCLTCFWWIWMQNSLKGKT